VAASVAEIEWFYPRNLNEVPEILSREGVVPYGGGTGIQWVGLSRIRGLIDISRLDLKSFAVRDGTITLGAALSYTEAAEALEKEGHLLARALYSAASEPLRNRISLGGSIAMFPYWSDLMGALLALEAELTLVGAAGGSRRLAEYVENRSLRQNTLISAVRIPASPRQGAYYRHTRTRTDRPAFSITVLVSSSSGRIEEIRVLVVGCSGRYRRLSEVEQALRGMELSGDPAGPVEEAALGLQADFPPRMGFSAEYLKACAGIELARALRSALGSSPERSS
jgi:CO/xanthine dehydrogenase FAD-binding subunit